MPHRDPFLFVDCLESWTHLNREVPADEIVGVKEVVGVECVSHYRVRAEHPIFAGHFPGKPILPGVVQVEMMAQASSFTLFRCLAKPLEGNMDVALLGISSAKFRKPIIPGMELVIKTVCTKARGSIVTHDCQIFCNEQLMSEASAMASVKI